MQMRLSVIFATLVLSSLGYSQVLILNPTTPDSFQVGYATYLKNGDSTLILSNSGASDPGGPGMGNLCVNTYVFDTREEMNECCACTVTPDGFRSMSAKNDLTSNPITGIAPTNIIIKLVATVETAVPCDAASVNPPAAGMTAWGTTLAPAPPAGKTYSVVPVIYKGKELSQAEYASLTTTCSFIFQLGSGSGICKCGVSGD
jgi:hypothetical protein